MPRGIDPGEIHTDNALDYKQRKIDEIKKNLKDSLDSYGIPKDTKTNVINEVSKNIDKNIAELEQAYLVMRTKRGEKITIQDMDDIMPYVRLSMLRDVFKHVVDRTSEGAQKLAEEIVALDNQIGAAKTKIKELKWQLKWKSEATSEALKWLTTTAEYKNLEAANQRLWENTGTIETWKAVKDLSTQMLDTSKLKTEFNKEKKNVAAIKKAIESVYSKLSNMQNPLDGEEVQAFLGDIWFMIQETKGLNTSVAKNLVVELGEFEKVLQKTAASYTLDMSQYTSLLLMWQSMKSHIAAQEKALNTADKALNSVGKDIGKFKTAVDANIMIAENERGDWEEQLLAAEDDFAKKVEKIEPLITAEREAARRLGITQGEKKNLSKMVSEKSAEKNNASMNTDNAENARIDTVEDKLNLDTDQRIRINARNLIVRSGPSKASKYLLTADKKKAIMLQPEDTVTPVLQNGNIVTKLDGPREYTQVTLRDGTVGWISLSDKIGSKSKQEYGDINLKPDEIDTSKSYELKWDNIRLRTGFGKTADIIDVLDNKKVDHIHAFINKSEGDNAPEGSNLTWKKVKVIYKDGSSKIGYIAEQYLTEKSISTSSNPGLEETDWLWITKKPIPIYKDVNDDGLTPKEVEELPYGSPIAGRPGFVNSPFAGKNQLVDVTGMWVWAVVKCPYTGRKFKVPPQ